MPSLLHLDASARRASISREVGEAFATAWRLRHPDGSYTRRDLAADPVPFIGEAWTELCDHVLEHGITEIGRLPEAVRTPAQADAWKIVEPLLTELVEADTVLIATPMYNYSVPASLKAWFDQVTFPKMSLAGRRFVVTTARGGAYGPGAPKERFDYQERFLRDFFAGHFAVEDVTFVNAELVNSRLDPGLAHLRAKHDESYDAALKAAYDLGKEG
ncbi:FMN-dependent NADH-azoreductase [Spirillospora sp. CA-294931]|uniref:FMN-dependent NADH-azoreductase n=1 Tax=Spirillospora sp. CA-294931 TaxID=3240042 RepID=UPI003D900477